MKPAKQYASATAFRVALESRLKKMALDESLDLQRLRRQAAFDRLLCRLFAKPDAPWLLKGVFTTASVKSSFMITWMGACQFFPRCMPNVFAGMKRSDTKFKMLKIE